MIVRHRCPATPTAGRHIVYAVEGAATVSADGSFELRTDPHGVGAPAGDYAVLITWFPPRDENPNSNPKNKVPNKYSDPGKPLLKVTVKEGENTLEPFKLTL